jgi:hypothetical protein
MNHSLTRLTVAVIVLAGLFTLTASPLRASSRSQGDGAVMRQFIGVWRLVSWTESLKDGTTRPGITDAGNLVYTDVDRMCAVMMDSKRAKWPTGTPTTMTDAVARLAGHVSYCARVELHAAEGFVLHHVDLERSPNIVGTIRKRWFRFDGANRLILRIDPAELAANLAQSTLVWERVQK